jgi:hypothetical protein
LFHFLRRRRARATLDVGPVFLLEAVDADPSSRRARRPMKDLADAIIPSGELSRKESPAPAS